MTLWPDQSKYSLLDEPGLSLEATQCWSKARRPCCWEATTSVSRAFPLRTRITSFRYTATCWSRKASPSWKRCGWHHRVTDSAAGDFDPEVTVVAFGERRTLPGKQGLGSSGAQTWLEAPLFIDRKNHEVPEREESGKCVILLIKQIRESWHQL